MCGILALGFLFATHLSPETNPAWSRSYGRLLLPCWLRRTAQRTAAWRAIAQHSAAHRLFDSLPSRTLVRERGPSGHPAARHPPRAHCPGAICQWPPQCRPSRRAASSAVSEPTPEPEPEPEPECPNHHHPDPAHSAAAAPCTLWGRRRARTNRASGPAGLAPVSLPPSLRPLMAARRRVSARSGSSGFERSLKRRPAELLVKQRHAARRWPFPCGALLVD